MQVEFSLARKGSESQFPNIVTNLEMCFPMLAPIVTLEELEQYDLDYPLSIKDAETPSSS